MIRKLVLLLVLLVLVVPVVPVQAGSPQNPPITNPLTGLEVNEPELLALPPALVSVSNFPASARPQAGLSSSSIVFEMYIGEGMTRFLALFYGDYPQDVASASGNQSFTNQPSEPAMIGPIRSGRVSYEKIRKFYNGFLVIASGYSGVVQQLRQYTNYFGSEGSDVNGAMIPVSKLEEIAAANPNKIDSSALTGMTFDENAPVGKKAQTIWLPFSYYNQVFWRYDTTSGAYQRYQDQADAKTFVRATDRLNGEALAYENVVILFADHEKISDTIYDLNLGYISRAPALLFRDGQMHEIFWTTANDEYEKTTGKLRPIRFVDADGNPFPFKPGQTWVEIVTPATYFYETVDSEVYSDLMKKREPDSGIWAVRFLAP